MSEVKTTGRYGLLIVLAILLVLGANAGLLAAQGTSGNNYYVDAINGLDSNPGTSADAPWQTLSRVEAQQFRPGDVIHFKRGSTWTVDGQRQRRGFIIDDSGIEGNPITFTAYGTGEKPIFRNPGGPDLHTQGITIDGSWIVLEGIMVRDTWRDGIYLSSGANHNVVRDAEVTNTGIGVGVYGQYSLITQNYVHSLHMVVNTPGGDDDMGAVGIWLFNSYNEVSYNTIVDCNAPSYDYGSDGGSVEIYAGYNNVNGNYIHHNYTERNSGFMEIGGKGYDVHSLTIAHNLIIDCTVDGLISIHTAGAWGVNIEDVRVHHNTIVDHYPSEGNAHYQLIGFTSDDQGPSDFKLENNCIYLDWVTTTWATQQQIVRNAGNITHDHNLIYLANDNCCVLGFTPHESEIINRDPVFVSIGAWGNPGDYHLQSSSPAIDAGADLGYPLDFDGNPVPVGPAPDIGSYEYIVVRPTATAMPSPTGPTPTMALPTITATPLPPTATPIPTNTATPNPNELIIDDKDSGFITSSSQDDWQEYTADGGQHIGNTHRFNRLVGGGQDIAAWSFIVPRTGKYEVYAWWWEGAWRPADVPYTIYHLGNSATVRVDQRINGGQWSLLGVFDFDGQGSVIVSDDVSSGQDIVADAVRLLYVGPLTSATATPTHTATASVTPVPPEDTPTHTATATPTHTATATPTHTATATPTHTATASVTPVPPEETPTVAPVPRGGDVTMYGKVYDALAGLSQGIPGARLSLTMCLPGNPRTWTDAEGDYSLVLSGPDLDACLQTMVQVKADGYSSLSVVLPVPGLRTDPRRDFALLPKAKLPTEEPTLRETGDVNGDRQVNLFDLVIVSSAYDPGGPVANPAADTNSDGSVDLFDLVRVSSNYGATFP